MKIDLAKWQELAKELLVKIAGVLKALAEPAGRLCALLAEKSAPLTSRLAGRFAAFFPAFEKKPRQFLIIGGVVVFLLVLVIIAVALSAGGHGENIPVAAHSIHAIAPEELFIPDEPNFVPDFLLEREPRHFWSVEDIRPYWRTPGAQEFWQGIIRSTVEELMENVR